MTSLHTAGRCRVHHTFNISRFLSMVAQSNQAVTLKKIPESIIFFTEFLFGIVDELTHTLTYINNFKPTNILNVIINNNICHDLCAG